MSAIPEDLKELYDSAKGFAQLESWMGSLSKRVMELIERIATLTAELAGIKQERDSALAEVEDWKNAGATEEDEFQDICASENIRPSDCCKPKYCRLAPFHEIKLLRAALASATAPVTDGEWIALCAGDVVRSADVERRDVDALLSARTAAAPEREP